ncbi:chromate transporter [Lederbergia citrea]|uniref:chromate transporter n=1 Tax=Lederbergia citrea TaxID=2833581 RepID=UPI001BC8D6EC|nr:chromate transporter [Lederbergia citrea]MBS4178306.1 chromate transporter [Lederbergia citrea]MBS4204982.1 chromate transporter [Lederbergia citrea]
MKQKDIFIAFFRSGMLGFGGGPSAIPLVHREVVQTFKWMNDEEFADVLALANALPGPINTKMAGYVGWRVGGFWGMLNALFATAIPTVVLMILFLTLLAAHKDKPWVAGMSQAVMPVAGVLLGVLTWDFIVKSRKSLGWIWTIFLVVSSVIVLQLLGIHPGILIAALLGAALLSGHNMRKKQEKGAQS